MKRLQVGFKKFISVLLLSLTLSFSVASSYQQGATAYATAVPIGYGLAYLFEVLLAGSGVALASDDFEKLYGNYNWEDWCNVLTTGMTTAEKEEWEAQAQIEFSQLQGVSVGDTINLKDFHVLIPSMQNYISSALNLGNVKGDAVTYTNSDLTGLSIANKYLGGGACSDSFVSEIFTNAGNFCLVYRSAEGSGITFNNVKHSCYQIFTLPASNLEKYVLYRYPVNTDVYALKLVSKDTFSGSGVGTFFYEYVWNYPGTGLLQRYKSGSLNGVGYSSYLYLNGEEQTLNGLDLIAFHCNYPIFDQTTADVARKFIDTPFYSFLENALVLPDTITIGNLDGITAVDDAIAANPDATDEELAAAVTEALSNQIAKEQEIKDAVDDNTDAIVTGNTWLEKIFNLLSDVLKSIMSALSATGLLGAISSTLTDMLSFPEEIADELSKVLSIDNVISAIQALPKAIGEAIDIPIDFTDVISALKALPQAISDVLVIPVPDVLDDILAGILAIPGALDIPVPDLGVLDDILTGVLTIPGDITDAIGRIFVLDFSVVEVAADGLAGTFDLKFPFIPLFKDMLDLSFPDTYDYPVFKIRTPDAIKQFWKEDYIILFDGKNYASHFLTIRTLLGCLFWLRFIYSVLNRFKVQLHIG